MFSVLNIGANGLATESALLNAVSENIANVNTVGYARRQAELASQPAVAARPANVSLGKQALGPGLALTSGALLAADVPVFDTTVIPTGQPGDVAINGAGFFAVTQPNGSVAYTRAGNFNLDANRVLVLASGLRLYPPVTIPLGDSYTISSDGTVTTHSPNGTTQVVGQIRIASVPNPQGMVAIGQNLYQPSGASGQPVMVVPGTQNTGTLAQGALNASNVNLANTFVDMVQAETLYNLSAKVVTVDQQINRATTNLTV